MYSFVLLDSSGVFKFFIRNVFLFCLVYTLFSSYFINLWKKSLIYLHKNLTLSGHVTYFCLSMVSSSSIVKSCDLFIFSETLQGPFFLILLFCPMH